NPTGTDLREGQLAKASLGGAVRGSSEPESASIQPTVSERNRVFTGAGTGTAPRRGGSPDDGVRQSFNGRNCARNRLWSSRTDATRFLASFWPVAAGDATDHPCASGINLKNLRNRRSSPASVKGGMGGVPEQSLCIKGSP